MIDENLDEAASRQDRDRPVSTRAKTSAERAHDLSMSNMRLGDNAQVHLGHYNIDRVENLVLGQSPPYEDVISDILNNLETPLYRDFASWFQDDYEREVIDALRWVASEPVPDKVLRDGPGPLAIIDQTGKAHCHALVATMIELYNRILAEDLKANICYSICDSGDKFETVLCNLLKSLVSQDEDLAPILRSGHRDLQSYRSATHSIRDFLLELLLNLLERPNIAKSYIFIDCVDSCTTECQARLFQLIIASVTRNPSLTWVLSSKINCTSSLGLSAASFSIAFGQVFKSLQLDTVYHAIRSSTAPLKLDRSREPQLPTFQYTYGGRNWLKSECPSQILCERRGKISSSAEKAEWLHPVDDASNQLRRFSGRYVVQSHVYLETPVESLNRTRNELIWKIFAQLANGIHGHKFALRSYLLEIPREHWATLVSISKKHFRYRIPISWFTQLLRSMDDRIPLVFLTVSPGFPLEVLHSILLITKHLPSDCCWKLIASVSSDDKIPIVSITADSNFEIPALTVDTEYEGNSQIRPLSSYGNIELSLTGFLLIECLESLSFEDMNETKRYVPNALPGSNQWIWSNQTFRQWRHDAGLLWISGPPGTGKSVLCKTILNSFDYETSGSMHLCAWFYSARRLKKGKSHVLMLRAVLHSILVKSPRSFETVQGSYRARFQSSESEVVWGDQDESTLAEFLKAIATDDLTPPMILMLNGLDESLDDQSGQYGDEALLELLSFLAYGPDSHMWLIVCSRPVPGVWSELLQSFHIPIHKHNLEDVKFLTDHGILRIRAAWPHRNKTRGGRARYANPFDQAPAVEIKKLKEEEELELKGLGEYLINYSSGSMIWIKLVFSELEQLLQRKEGFTLKQLREKAQALPRDLHELYGEIVTRLGLNQDLEKSRMSEKIFLWVTGAPEWGRLQLRELWEGLAIPDDVGGCTETAALSDLQGNLYQIGGDWYHFYSIVYVHCGGLLEFLPPSQFDDSLTSRVDEVSAEWSVHLIHRTAKTFLEAGDNSWPFRIVEVDAIQYVSKQSLRYLEIIFSPQHSCDILNPPGEVSPNTLSHTALGMSTYQAMDTLSRDDALALLQPFIDIPKPVKQGVEHICHFMDAKPLLLFALNVMRDGNPGDEWMSSQKLPDFLTWWLLEGPDPLPGTLATAANLAAYLCNSGLIDALSLLFDIRKAFVSRPMTRNMLLGILYGASYAALQLQADSSAFPRLVECGESLGYLLRRLEPWFLETISQRENRICEPDLALRGVLMALEDMTDTPESLSGRSSSVAKEHGEEVLHGYHDSFDQECEPVVLRMKCVKMITDELYNDEDTEAWSDLHSRVTNWPAQPPLVRFHTTDDTDDGGVLNERDGTERDKTGDKSNTKREGLLGQDLIDLVWDFS